MWRQRNLSLECKSIIFKTLVLSKFVFLAQVLLIPNEITSITQRIQRKFLWNSNNVKIKHETICNDFQNGGLKNVDTSSKMSSLHCFWVKKLYDQNSHDWKLIPMHFINDDYGVRLWESTLFFIQISVSKLLYSISFLLFMQTFLNHGKETFLISLTLLIV